MADYIIIGCFRAVFRRKPLRPLRKRKDVAEEPRFRSRQARPSRRIAQLSVATSATLPAHRAAFGRDRRDPPGAAHSFRSRQARPSRRITQLSVATGATLPAHRTAFGRDRRDPPGASRSFRSRQARPSRRSHIAEGPRFRSRQARPSRRIAQPRAGGGAGTSRAEPYVPSRGKGLAGIRPCGDQALATLIFAAWPLRSQEAASGHAANESAVASVSAFT